MNPISKYTIGLRFGLVAGLLYIILLFCRFKFFGSNPQTYFYFTLVSYCLILFVFLFAGIARKKELGGYAHLREIFQSVLIAILITELVYVLFVFIYMKFIDPEFLKNFHDQALAFYQKSGLPDQQINESMKGVDSLVNQAKPGGLLKGYGFAVVLDSIFGFLFAFILRRQPPVSQNSK